MNCRAVRLEMHREPKCRLIVWVAGFVCWVVGRVGDPDLPCTAPKSSLVMHSLTVKESELLMPQMPLLLQVH